ncbi:uncharacterized protein LOC143365601 [Halictus rubicundus]|uniref:uncharacterized protein LOC143365601 n=1 Tax=Halictus rubicundus TaxID=77578 RepID=UPI0040372DFA
MKRNLEADIIANDLQSCCIKCARSFTTCSSNFPTILATNIFVRTLTTSMQIQDKNDRSLYESMGQLKSDEDLQAYRLQSAIVILKVCKIVHHLQ